MNKFALALGLALVAGPSFAKGPLPFTVAETGARFGRLADAVEAIGNGAGTIRIAPGRYGDCAVQEAGRIFYVADEPGTVVFDGGICEGKATLVLRGRSARVEGLTFVHDRVEDGNGAGIRIEQGDLTVSNSLFDDGQCGILSAADPNGTITIDHSTFRRLGKEPDGDGAHSVYIGHYGAVKVTNSRFERGTGGHYLKSRAPRVEVLNSSFDDSQGHATNYMIDLPEGAVGRIAGNSFLSGLDKENHATMIAVGAEDITHSSAGLTVEGNEARLAPSSPWTTAFVGDWTHEALVVRGNKLGPGITPLKRY